MRKNFKEKLFKTLRDDKFAILIILLTVLVNYSYFLYQHYAVDSYKFQLFPEQFAEATSALGRPLNGILIEFLTLLNINPVEDQQLLTLPSLLLMSIATYYLYFNLRKDSRQNSSIILLGTLLLVVSPFMVAMLTFPEMTPGVALSFLLVVLGGVQLSNEKYGKAFMLMLFSTYFYQSWVYLAPAIAIVKGAKDKSRILKHLGLLLMALAINFITAIIINSITGQDIINSNRANISLETIIANILFVPQQIYDILFESFGILHANIHFALLLLVILFTLKILQPPERSKFLLSALIIFGFVVLVPAGPTLISEKSVSHPRIFIASGALFSIIFLLATTHYKLKQRNLFLLGILALTLFTVSNLNAGRQLLNSNKIDQQQVNILEDMVRNYEDISGIGVDSIKIESDERLRVCKVSGKCYRTITNSALATVSENPTYYAITVHSDLELKKVNTPQTNVNENWLHFVPSEQVYFEGPTVVFTRY